MRKPPSLPFFPLVMKDLAFMYEANPSKVDGLINFEKLRMMARELRKLALLQSHPYDEASLTVRIKDEKKVRKLPSRFSISH